MGSYRHTGTWSYSNEPTETRQRDRAEADTGGSNGDIVANTSVAVGHQSSSANAAHTMTWNGRMEWIPAGPNDPAPSHRLVIRATYTGRSQLTVNAQGNDRANAAARAEISLEHGGRVVESRIIHDRKVSAPPSREEGSPIMSAVDVVLSSPEIEFTGSTEFKVTVTVSSSSDRTGEASAKTSSSVRCDVVAT